MNEHLEIFFPSCRQHMASLSAALPRNKSLNTTLNISEPREFMKPFLNQEYWLSSFTDCWAWIFRELCNVLVTCMSTRVQRKTFQQTDLRKVVLYFHLEMRVSLLAVYSDPFRNSHRSWKWNGERPECTWKPLHFQLFTNHGMIQRGNDNIYLKSHDIQSVAISVTLKYSHSYQYLSKHKGEVVGCLACVWAILFLT